MAMPVRVSKRGGGFRSILDKATSSASADGSSSQMREESSSGLSLASSGASPATAGKPKGSLPKVSPGPSSHGTPAGGSVHLDVAASASDAETVDMADQFEAEGKLNNSAANRGGNPTANRGKDHTAYRRADQEAHPRPHLQQDPRSSADRATSPCTGYPKQAAKRASSEGSRPKGNAQTHYEENAAKKKFDNPRGQPAAMPYTNVVGHVVHPAGDPHGNPAVSAKVQKCVGGRSPAGNAGAVLGNIVDDPNKKDAIVDKFAHREAPVEPGAGKVPGKVLYREGSDKPPALEPVSGTCSHDLLLGSVAAMPPMSRARQHGTTRSSQQRRRSGSAGFGLGRDGTVLPVVAPTPHATKRAGDNNTEQQPARRNRASPSPSSSITGITAQDVETMLANRLNEQSKSQEAVLANMVKQAADMEQRFAAMLSHSNAAVQSKDHELSTANRVSDQLRAELRDAAANSNAERAMATQLRQDAASAKHELAESRATHVAQVAKLECASHDAALQASASAKAEAELRHRRITEQLESTAQQHYDNTVRMYQSELEAATNQSKVHDHAGIQRPCPQCPIKQAKIDNLDEQLSNCLLYTSPSPRD